MQDVEKLKRRWQREDEQAVGNAISALALHAEGRKFLWWLLEIGGIGRQPFSGNALGTAFACGELNVGQRILDRIISVTPDGYLSMMRESADERRTRDAELDGGNGRDFTAYGETGRADDDYDRGTEA